MKKNKIKFTVAIILSCIVIISFCMTLIYSIKNKTYTQAGKIQNNQSASDKVEIPTSLDQVFSGIGRYNFNVAMGTNTAYGDNTRISSAISAVGVTQANYPEYICKPLYLDEYGTGYLTDTVDIGYKYISGTTFDMSKTVQSAIGGGGNSSKSELKYNGGTIKAAYLVVSATTGLISKETNSYGTDTQYEVPRYPNLLNTYPMTLIGPKGDTVTPKLELFQDETGVRTSGYVDVTEFVKEQGYGDYIGKDIPYLDIRPGLNDKGQGVGTSEDKFASWKLIVIEENEENDIKSINLKLGGVQTKGTTQDKIDVQINRKEVGIKKDNPKGQLLISVEGTENSGQVTFNGNPLTGESRADGKFFIARPEINGEVMDIARYPVIRGENEDYNTDLILADISSEAKPYISATLPSGSSKVDMEIVNNTNATVFLVNALGLSSDIETPIYKTEITHKPSKGFTELLQGGNVDITLKVTNTSKEELSGLHGGKTYFTIDEDILLDNSTAKAYFTDENGEKVELTSNMYKIEGNKVTIDFGKNSEAISQKGDYITFTITGKNKVKKDNYTSNSYTDGNLITENGEKVDILLEKITSGKDSYNVDKNYSQDIIINKIWKDNEIQAKRRPESLVLVVKKENNEEVIRQEITKNNVVAGTTNQWAITIKDLQKYDENGQEIKYIVEEKEKNQGDLDFYEVEENNVEIKDNQATIRNTFVNKDETRSIKITKNWLDNNNINGKRPDEIKLIVSDGTNEISQIISKQANETGENTWETTIENLPKYNENGEEIQYTIKEAEVSIGDLKFYTISQPTGDMVNGFEIENTFNVPAEQIELTVNKKWVDNEIQAKRRPKTIVLNVKAKNADNNNPEEIIKSYELKTSEETNYTFTELPKYNNKGNEIEYIVEEQEKTSGNLKFYTTTIGDITNIENNENKKQVIITNTFEKPEELTQIPVTKIWDDNNNKANKRPTSIKLQLKNENKIIKEQEVNNTNSTNGDANTWSYTFEKIEKYNENGEEIKYTVDETEVNNNDLQFYTATINGTTITNKFTQNVDKVEIPVTKIWEDNEIQVQRRPESVIIILKANGKEIQRYELSEATANNADKNTWNYIFKELPKYDEDNNRINYTVEEQEKTQGDLKFYTSKIEDTTITNTFTRPTETISIEVNKIWEDQENIYNKRPETIKLEVKNGDIVEDDAIVTKEENWKYTFTNLNKYDENGQEIQYTVDEKEVLENDLYHYEKEIGELTNKEGKTNEKQVTITNIMTKIPGTVVIKYIDKNTGEEITDSKTKEGIVGEEFDIAEDEKEIPGYTLIEKPEETTGEFTDESQEKIYYYAKTTQVIVKYLEKDTNIVLSKEKVIYGHEGLEYKTNMENIENYTCVENTNNTSGVMTRDKIEVIYYYAKNTKVIVKYLDKATNEPLTEETQYEISGYVGKDYTTEKKEIEGYTFIEDTKNTSGKMTEQSIEVIYYYGKNTQVVVKYLEKDTNKELSEQEIIKGYEGQEYKTQQKDIENYEFVESTNNTKGIMQKEQIEVIYYYAQKTKATVQHIDRETGKILKEESKDGLVGDIFETKAENFEGYILVEAPENPNITMTKEEQIVKYYYVHISSGVIEKHIDEITGEIIYEEIHEGNEGDKYNIPSKEFEGYDLVTEDSEGNSKLPENAEGEMTKEAIEVKYYYIRKATVRVEYIDKTTGEKITEDEIMQGHQNDNYETEEKEFDGYNLVEKPENAKGQMIITKNEDGTYNTETVVTYYYQKISGGVTEKHIDINTNEILEEETHKGNVGDEYNIPSKQFEKYDLVEIDEEGNSKLPENATGKMTEEPIEVIYYYIKKATVKIEYIDRQTGEKLAEDEIIEGHEGDRYQAEEKEFDGYELVEIPSNSNGEMKDEIVVKYYYERKAEVEIKYIEKETGYELTDTETIEGYVGDEYTTEEKEIPYYKFIEKTENYKGNMEKDKITVIYYYEKQIFNLGIDKWISNVNIDGINKTVQNIENKDEIYKVDIHRTKTETTDIKITYKIRITNKGEVEGTVGEIVEIIPEGYSYKQQDNNIHWEERNGTLVTDVLKDEIIKEGEYKELEITLTWNKGKNNFGEKNNTVLLTKIENPAGYEDINKEDNTSKSKMIVSIETGLDRNSKIIIIGIVQIILAISVGLLVSYKKKTK